MAGRYRQSSKNNRSRFYILLSVIFVIVMFKWGIPLFMNLVAGQGAERLAAQKDIIPPQNPVISALPEATNSARVVIEGFTERGAVVELLIDDVSYKMSKADENGLFTFDAVLSQGQNKIQIRAKDEEGNESVSEVSIITYDSKPIELSISSPKDGSEFYGKLNQVIDIKGEVDKKNSQVLINNSFVTLDSNGSFVHRFMLSDGDNTLTIRASDKAGNVDEKSLNVVYFP
jgi:bacillopeptidase F